jgi:membrane-bound metal-dependent hydrolase YbcI (DUF457 family)
MARKEAHALVGALAGGVSYCLVKDKLGEDTSFLEFGLAILWGAILGMLPDLLEPANDPNHRGAMHSAAALTACVCLGKGMLEGRDVASWKKTWSVVACSAYASHLLVDGVSPRSLPLLGLKAAALEI